MLNAVYPTSAMLVVEVIVVVSDVVEEAVVVVDVSVEDVFVVVILVAYLIVVVEGEVKLAEMFLL